MFTAESLLKELTQALRFPCRPSLVEMFNREFFHQLHYASSGQWITIGGSESGGKKHAGGTPVKVGQGGKIEAGPKNLQGQDLDRLDRNVAGTAQDRRQPPPAGRQGSDDRTAGTPLDAAYSHLERAQARAKGERAPETGHATIPEGVGRRAWAHLRQNPDQATWGRDGKFQTATVDTPRGKLTLYHPLSSGLPFPAELEPATKQSPPAADGKQRQGTMFPGVRPQAVGKPKPPQKDTSQKPLFDKAPLKGGQVAADGGPPPAPQPSHGFGPHVRELPDGRLVGEAIVDKSQLAIDPDRFQYKVKADAETGLTDALSDVNRYDPDFGGQLLVWRDPQDGKAYVINGHHRYGIAERSQHWEDPETGKGWHGQMSVRFIGARSAPEARAMGALANIAGGRGTAMDAAKFLRDSGLTIDDMRRGGISLKGPVAERGAVLAHASDAVFKRLIDESIPEDWAYHLAKHLPNDPDEQNSILSEAESKYRKGKDISASVIAEMAEAAAGAPKVTETQGRFAGMEETRSVRFEKAIINDAISRRLGQEHAAWDQISKSRRQGKYEEGGNVLNTEENQRRAAEAKGAKGTFAQEKRLKGPLSDATAKHAIRYAEAKTESERRRIVEEAVAEALATLRTPQSAAKDGAAAGTQGDSGGAADADRRPDPRNLSMFSRDHQQLVERFNRAMGCCQVERYAWDEQKHPRGQPKNKGQFAKQSGGGESGDKPAKSGKLTISQAGKKLAALGYKLGAPQPYDLQNKQASYQVTGPDGKTSTMTGKQIKQLVAGGAKAPPPVAQQPQPAADDEPTYLPEGVSADSLARSDALMREPQDAAELEQFLAAVELHPYRKEVKRRMDLLEAETPGGDVREWSRMKHSTVGPDGQRQYSAQRLAEHQEIIRELLTPESKVKPGEKPVAVFLMGPPAAGKTTAGAPLTKRLGVQFTTINPDDAKEKFKEYQGWNAGALHEESCDVAEHALLDAGIDNRHHLAFDLTGNNLAKMTRTCERLRAAGYDIHVIDVHLPDHKAAHRAWNRFRKRAFKTSKPGRFVPPVYSAKVVDGNPARNYEQMKQMPFVKSWTKVSTDVPEGHPPIVLDQGERG